MLLSMNAEARQLISRLGLVPLPHEGGYFARTWTSPRKDPGGRAIGSAILFMITEMDFSALHRLGTDEMWIFNAGDPAELVRIDPQTGSCSPCVLGPDIAGGHAPQAVVASGIWQGARILPAPGAGHGWTLFSCTVAPAWDEREFELAQRDALVRAFPAHAALVRALTR
jgi:predicted cupin superfamily sugar epimerase